MVPIALIVATVTAVVAPPSSADPFAQCPEDDCTKVEPATEPLPGAGSSETAVSAQPLAVPKPRECKREDYATFEEFVDCQISLSEKKKVTAPTAPPSEAQTEAARMAELYNRLNTAATASDWPTYYSIKAEIDRVEALRVQRAREREYEQNDWNRPSRRSYEHQVAAWNARDSRLLGMTVGFGVGWGISLVLVGVFAGLTHSQANDCIETAATHYTVAESCTRTTGLAAAMWTFAATSGATGAGLLASGITLAVHRGNRPTLSLSPSSLRLRF